VQALPSLHVVPLPALVCAEHCPVDGLQVPATLHAAAAGQVTGLEPTHAPDWQLSVCVQPLPSSQPVPLAAFVGVGHSPVEGLQVPATLQVGAVHVIVGPGVHVPLWQVSPTVQPLLSLQPVPFATGAHVPVAVAQVVQPPHAAPAFCHMPFASHICG
jgi:hypothetical protein